MVDGKLTISRVICSDKEDHISIQLADEKSRNIKASIQISPRQLALALTGSGDMDCKYHLYERGVR